MSIIKSLDLVVGCRNMVFSGKYIYIMAFFRLTWNWVFCYVGQGSWTSKQHQQSSRQVVQSTHEWWEQNWNGQTENNYIGFISISLQWLQIYLIRDISSF